MRLKPVLFFTAVTLLAGFFIYRENRGGGATGEVVVGRVAPDFEIKDQAGKSVRLSDFRGNLVFLNFWATWCPPCVDEMPEMDLLNRKFAGANFKMLTISVDTNWEIVNAFYKQHGIDLPTFLDPGRKVSGMYRARGYPETYLIDANGIVLKKYVGPEKWASPAVIQQIQAMIPGSSVTGSD